MRVAQLGRCVLDRRPIGFDLGPELSDDRFLVVHLLLAGELLRLEEGVAGEVLARIAELRFVLRERGAGLIERGLIRTRIDLREQLSTLDLLALPEGNIRELSVDL